MAGPYFGQRLLQVAALAEAYPARYPSAADLGGIPRDQPDEPWWLTEALAWVRMARIIESAAGGGATHFRPALARLLEEGRPDGLYALFEGFRAVLEAGYPHGGCG